MKSIRLVFLCGLFACNVLLAAPAPVTVTITQGTPIQTLSTDGNVSGVAEATIGSHYTLVRVQGSQLVLQDAQGTHYLIAQTSTDVSPEEVQSQLTANQPPQPEVSKLAPSMSNLPQGLALIVNTVPSVLEMNGQNNAKLEVNSLPSGTLITPLNIRNGSFVVRVTGRKITSSQIAGDNGLAVDLKNPFSGSPATNGAHYEDKIEEWNGTGLIPIKNTNYSQLVATTQATLAQNNVNTPASMPLPQGNSSSSGDSSSNSQTPAVQPQASAAWKNSLSKKFVTSGTTSASVTNGIETPVNPVTTKSEKQLAQNDDRQQLVNANLAVSDGQSLLVNGFYDEAAKRFQYAIDASNPRGVFTFAYNRAKAGLAAAKAGQAQKFAYDAKFAQAASLLQQAILLQPDSLVYTADVEDLKKQQQSHENDIHGSGGTVTNTNNAVTDDLKIKGIIILNAVAGYEAANLSFVSIEWVDNYGGVVVDSTGAKTAFLNGAVRKIIYFDPAYYAQIDQRGDWFATRFGIKKYEMVIDTVNLNHITSSDLKTLQTEEQALEATAQAYTSASALFQSPILELKDDISRVSNDQTFQNGKWFTKEELAALPPPPSIGRFVKIITLTTPDGKQYTNVIVDGRLDASGTINEKQYTKIAPLTLSDASKIVNDNGGTALFSSANSDFPFVECDLTGLSQEVLERVAEARLEALFNFASNGTNTQPVAIGTPLILPKKSDASSSFIPVFVNAVEIIGRQSPNILSVQKELSEDVLNVLMKNLPDPNNRVLIWNAWPELKKAISFTSQQQIDFYKLLMEQRDLSINQFKDVLNQANSADSLPDVKSFVANWTDQLASADKLDGQMEAAMVALLSDPANKVLLKQSETKEELGKPLNFGLNGDAIAKNIESRLSQTNLSCVTSELEAYQNSWSKLKLIPQLRSALAGGKLSDAESLASMLGPDPNSHIDSTPGQKLAADACATSVSLYESQKKAAQDLLDDAERLRTLGGQNSKALQDYKDAYQLDNDPAILQKIKDLNNESLGI